MTGLDRLSTHRQRRFALCPLIYYIINIFVASVRVHMDGRVTPGSQSGGGHDENRKIGAAKINNRYRYKRRLVAGTEQRIEFRGRG